MNECKIKELVELCKAIDAEEWLLDVQCQEDEDLVNKWRKAYKFFTEAESDKPQGHI